MRRPLVVRAAIRTARLAVLAAALAVAGCSEPSEPPAGEATRSAADTIAAHRRRLQDVPGRSGILAERALYSLLDEELIIRDFFRDRRDGFFLDVGCAWPDRASNTYYLEKHLGWRGIGVDALAEYSADWEQLRPRSKFRSYLVTDHSGGTGRFFRSPNPGLSSTNPKLATGVLLGEHLEPEEIRVPMITLDDLLEQEGVAKIDLLSMDIEGHEAKALAGFDLERFAPELVVIEGFGDASLSGYFAARGYRLIQRYLPFDEINRYFERTRPASPDASPATGRETRDGPPRAAGAGS